MIMVIKPSVEAREHLDKAYDLLNREEYEAALRECQSAAELQPDCAEVHNLRGVVLDDSGRLEEAIAAYRLALHYDPGFEHARENLAEIEQEIEPVTPVASSAPTVGKGFGIRAASYLIDTVVFFIASWVGAFLAGIAAMILLFTFAPHVVTYLAREPVSDHWLSYVTGLIVYVLYFAVFEWLYGATPGKLVLGMRVIARDGGRCSAKAALTRGLLRYWDAFFFCVPALVTMGAPLQQRVGDKVARTMVVGSKDPAVGERRDWGWFLVAGGLFVALRFAASSLALLIILMAAGQL